MNYHFTHDNVFFDDFINLVEDIAPNTNQYIIFLFDVQAPIIKNKKAIFLNISNPDFEKISKNISLKDKVFIHALSNQICPFILTLDSSIPVYWCFWGADLFNPLTLYSNTLLDRQTRNLLYKNNKLNILPESILNKYYYYKNKYSQRQIIKKKAILRVNFFLHFCELDFLELKKYFKTNAIYLKFTYGFKPASTQSYSTTDNIKYLLLGNSGSATNNHLEALDVLNNLKTDFKIICPLSYGEKWNIDAVIEKGKNLFEDKFIPLTDFLPKDEYFELINKVDCVYMNHYRTQAAGNIINLLYLGKKIIFNEKNNFYYYLKELGLTVFAVKKNNITFFNTTLTDKQKSENRAIILNHFSYESSKKYLIDIFEAF